MSRGNPTYLQSNADPVLGILLQVHVGDHEGKETSQKSRSLEREENGLGRRETKKVDPGEQRMSVCNNIS